ncbi:uncharacterized protein LOC120316552 isoform X1 [Crotalus tigris]|uniref:uncharacterized protein LOC120316552 isoform X1 n=1 Tax=Crotalus tigris TaxID=88082 RepID=UPI00192F6885|nr:uncharacterized protein LOC120316552 isoform X1 [Crotalus tigris]
MILNAGYTLTVTRKDGVMPRNHTLSKATLQRAPVVPTSVSKSGDRLLKLKSEGATKGPEVAPVVVLPSDGEGTLVQGSQPSHPYNGCQPIRLGSAPAITASTGSMVKERPKAQHKLARTQSHTPGPPSLPQHNDASSRAHTHGQGSGQSACQPTRHAIQGPHDRSTSTGNLGRKQPSLHQGRAHLRRSQSPGRLPEQDNDRPLRVEPAPCSLQKGSREIQTSSVGPVCQSKEYSASEILLSFSDTRSRESGCTPKPLAKRTAVCIPTCFSDTSNHQEDIAGTSGGDTHCTALAKMALVCQSRKPIYISTMEDSSLNQGSLLHPDPQWLQLTTWRLSGIS